MEKRNKGPVQPPKVTPEVLPVDGIDHGKPKPPTVVIQINGRPTTVTVFDAHRADL